MDDLDRMRAVLLAKPGAEETYPFDAVTLVAKVGGGGKQKAESKKLKRSR
jgi:hypothetical protein